MLQQVVPDDTFVISLSTALGMGEYLVALLNTVIQNLPELELRMMRNTLEQSVALADDLLFNISISSPFDTLTINDASIARGIDGFNSTTTTPRTPGRVPSRTPTKLPIPPSSPASVPNRGAAAHRVPSTSGDTAAPRDAAAEHKSSPTPNLNFVISTRPNVGIPNYEYHPPFAQTGIPGPYTRPPVDPSKPHPAAYYVITKGLYVGIFCSWLECGPWVLRVPGSVYLKVVQWEEARSLYNSRLAANTCEVLS